MSCLFDLKELYIPINDDEIHNALCGNLLRKQWSFLRAGINGLHPHAHKSIVNICQLIADMFE